VVLEDFQMEVPSTKDFVQVQKNLQIDGKKSLFVFAEADKHIYLSSRNLQKTKVVTLSGLNTYNIMDASVLVFSESSISKISNPNHEDNV